MSWIDLEPYEEYFPQVVGAAGTVNIHHCKEGRHNDRLYLTLTEEGKIIAFCHHCGGTGVHTPRQQQRKPLRASLTPSSDSFKKWGVPPLKDWSTCGRWKRVPFEDLPLLTRKWWFQNGLNVSEYEDAGVRCLDGSQFTIPLTWEGQVSGLAIRPFKEKLPKWIQLGSKQVAPFTQADSSPDILVITEDYLSALRLSRYYAALPLMGTSLNSKHFLDITKWYKTNRKILVWLDNDSSMVVQKAKDIRKRLAVAFRCGMISINREPKHFRNDSQIREVVSKNGIKFS
jgi:hypothetical protein